MQEFKHYFIIFGAAVLPTGSPSGTLFRRVEAAFKASNGRTDVRFLVTGGIGRYGPAEADVMKFVLSELGVPDSHIIRESEAVDTLSSVLLCKNILDRLPDVGAATVWSSRYHTVRCQLLFRILGMCVARGNMPCEGVNIGWAKWIYYCFREFIATPCDVIILVFKRFTQRMK